MTAFHDPFDKGHEGEYTVHRAGQNATPQWMLTIADLFSLILTFFVLLYSMSDVKGKEWQEMRESISNRLQLIDEQHAPYTPPKALTVEQVALPQARNLDYLWRVVNERFAVGEHGRYFSVRRDRDRIVLSLTDQALFEPGKTTIAPSAETALNRMAEFLANINNAITVEGHAGEAERRNGTYPSVWELSLARGEAIAEKLKQAGYPNPVDVYGTGEPLPGQAERGIDIVVRENVAK